jgi:hypothetical protein
MKSVNLDDLQRFLFRLLPHTLGAFTGLALRGRTR